MKYLYRLFGYFFPLLFLCINLHFNYVHFWNGILCWIVFEFRNFIVVTTIVHTQVNNTFEIIINDLQLNGSITFSNLDQYS